MFRTTYDSNGNRTARFVDTDCSETLNAGDTSITQYTWEHRNGDTRQVSPTGANGAGYVAGCGTHLCAGQSGSLLRMNHRCYPLRWSPFPAGAQSETNVDSPYGVYADIMKGQENAFVPKNLDLMGEAGLAWVRCDFYWDTMEGPQGTWHFDHLEKVLDQTEARGLNLLVILGYTVPWARPVCDHPEPWLEYVRRTVLHFKDRIKYWEIWNEQNLKSFWVADPDSKAYAQFLGREPQLELAGGPGS